MICILNHQTHLGKLNDFQRMLLIRSLRPDRMCITASKFTSNNLGPQFVDPPAFDLEAIYANSTYKTPLIFVLSPGVDPTSHVIALASKLDRVVNNCALGQGQAPIAERLLTEGLEAGHWVFLANIHLMLSWAPTLEKMIDTLATNADVHKNFRLWLTSDPSPRFPISILQRGIKMTTEPPSGLKANLMRLYSTISEAQFSRCGAHVKYQRLLFSLCWFHSLLLERRKFNHLGWNVPYEFNESDFAISEDVLSIYLDEYEDTPWDALKYLIAQVNYGGRVTDDWDRRLMSVYIASFFHKRVLELNQAKLSEDCLEYFVPTDGDLSSYGEYIRHLPQEDSPAAFGQHANAEIASQIEDGRHLVATVLSLQPTSVSEGGVGLDAQVHDICLTLVDQMPPRLDLEALKSGLNQDSSGEEALKTVLRQELDRYQNLVDVVHVHLENLERGMLGLVVITPELEEIYHSLLRGSVPRAWGFGYPSLKPLGPWTRELRQRVAQMVSWASESTTPAVFWLAGFTYPSGFLTAVLQTSARKSGVSIDSLQWEFGIVNQHEDTLTSGPKEGAYVRGLYLEGAAWDWDQDCLAEPTPMVLHCAMPLVHFKPVESKKKKNPKGTYSCPLYIYPLRTGTRERPSFIIAVDLKSGPSKSAEVWTKRGTALLLSLSE